MSDTVDFVKSFTNFSVALGVFGVSQGGKIFKALPTSDPTEVAREDFDKVTDTMKTTFDGNDSAVFGAATAVGGALIDIAATFFQPVNYAPKTVVETSINLARWGAGIAGQLVPGGANKGGPPTGWGPVNNRDAEITLPTLPQ